MLSPCSGASCTSMSGAGVAAARWRNASRSFASTSGAGAGMLPEMAVRSSPPPAALKGSGRGSPGWPRRSIAQNDLQAPAFSTPRRTSSAAVLCTRGTHGACTLSRGGIVHLSAHSWCSPASTAVQGTY